MVCPLVVHPQFSDLVILRHVSIFLHVVTYKSHKRPRNLPWDILDQAIYRFWYWIFCETHISLVTSSLFETFQHFLVNLTYWIDCMNNFFNILKWKEIQKLYVWVFYLLFVFLSAFSSILSRTRIIYLHILDPGFTRRGP